MTERETERMNPGRDAPAWYDAVPLPWILAVIIRGRRTIAALAAVGFTVAVIIALLRATYFTATFSFVPASANDQARSGLANLAGQIGLNVGALGGQAQSPQLYADLLQTHEILSRVATDTVPDAEGRRVPLSTFLHAKGETPAIVVENTVRDLRDRVVTTIVATRTTGMVTVTVRTRSAAASLAIAQRLLAGLNQFNVATRKTQAGEERRFIETRLNEARASLRAAENTLQAFLQGNRQYTGSPELAFQRARLDRDVTLQQQLVAGLSQQYEDARIREVRDTPVITVLEQPTLPVLPDPGGRALTVVLGTLGACLLGVVLVLARAGWQRQRAADTEGAGDYAALGDEWRTVRTRFGRS